MLFSLQKALFSLFQAFVFLFFCFFLRVSYQSICHRSVIRKRQIKSRSGKQPKPAADSLQHKRSAVQKLHMPVIDVVNRADDRRVVSVAQMVNVQGMTDLFDAVFHIQAAGAIRIGFVSDGKTDLICDVFDKAGWIVVNGSFNSAAASVPQYDHQIGPKMLLSVFDTAQLMIIDHIAGKADHKQLTDSGGKNVLRYHT